MFAFATGNSPAFLLVPRAAKPAACALLAAMLAAMLTACASDQAAQTSAYPAYAAKLADAAPVDVEDDGLPAQAPPRAGQRPDDPSEPYSRNYGGANPGSAGPGTASAPAVPVKAPDGSKPDIPNDLPPAFRRQLAAAMDAAE